MIQISRFTLLFSFLLRLLIERSISF
uniref:Uncharacterized protein n=1 Tax=Rhizophora mucronata TaxID=61149 RepID=A0A2P2LQ59_RHIMU